MSESVCSRKTKKKMANALKELMSTTTFENITVSDITQRCDIHRQTFYYHFQDRYELLNWLVYNDLLQPLTEDFRFDNMYDKLFDMFTTMQENKAFYQNALKINSDDLIRYVSTGVTETIETILKKLGEDNDIHSRDDKDIAVLAEFFGYGISGIVMNWTQQGMKESPRVMTDRLEHLVELCKSAFVQQNKI